MLRRIKTITEEETRRAADFAARKRQTIKDQVAEIKRRAQMECDRRWSSIRAARRRAQFWARHRRTVGLAAGAAAIAVGASIPLAIVVVIVARGAATFAREKARYDAQHLAKPRPSTVTNEKKSIP